MTVILDPLAFYARIGAALFPIPAGSKDPTGIIQSFARDHSSDPVQWAAWRTSHPNCNFGLVAGPSKVIIVDTDAKDDRDAAWAARCALFAEWGVPAAAMPHVQSARGGWHDIFAVPDGVDATTLRQPDAIKKIINVRAGNGYVVTAGSFYDGTAKNEASGHYILISDAPPHVAPDALIKHCTRVAANPSATTNIGTRDKNDIANLLKWLNDREQFAAYEDWFSIGMALKLEYGDAGLELWRMTHDETVTPEVEDLKWRSFASEPTANSVTLASWIQRAHKGSWRGSIGKSKEAMFGETIANMAKSAGASLQTPAGPMPLLAGQAKYNELAADQLADFLATNIDAPTRPQMSGYPQLPVTFCEHPLYQALNDSIDRVFAMAENKKLFRPKKITTPFAVLLSVDENTYQAAARKLRDLGLGVPDREIKIARERLDNDVKNAFKAHDNWIRNLKTGEIDNRSTDNIAFFLEFIQCEIRYNGWTEKIELKSPSHWPRWTELNDAIGAQLYMRAHESDIEYHVGKDFLWEGLLAYAHKNVFDPVLERIADLESKWDKVPRLDFWLSRSLGLEDEPYHRAVARNIIGGMVRRARKPGAKHDTMVVMIGAQQGTGKSTLAAIIADLGQSTLQQILDSGGQNFTNSIKLGHEAKELVLSLAGKLIAEIGEMGMRNTASVEDVKNMLSTQHDEGRTAYARTVTKRPRRNIFFGTSNQDQPLSDPTGNRRFLPIDASREIDLAWMAENIAQLIGEAATYETAGESFALPREIWEEAAKRQESARAVSDMEIRLSGWFAETSQTKVAYVVSEDLAELCNGCNLRGSNTLRGTTMGRLGFRKERPYLDWLNGRQQKLVWFRGTKVLPKSIERDAVRFVPSRDANGHARGVLIVPPQQPLPLPPPPKGN